MNSLLRTEWLKIKKYRAFWWMMGIIILSYPGIIYIFYKIYQSFLERGGETGAMIKMLVGNPFAFPEAWHTVAYASSLFIFIPSIVVIMFITNEYSYKTHRQNIIDGWSRNEFMGSKLIDVLLVSLMITILYFAVALITGYMNVSDGNSQPWEQTQYIGLFFLQTFAQLSIAFVIAFLARKAFIALGIFLFYFIILEPVIVGLTRFYKNDIGRFMPLEISDRLIPVPAFLGRIDPKAYQEAIDQVFQQVIYTIILLSITWFFCFWLNRRRDL
jgi:hypothetical protein